MRIRLYPQNTICGALCFERLMNNPAYNRHLSSVQNISFLIDKWTGQLYLEKKNWMDKTNYPLSMQRKLARIMGPAKTLEEDPENFMFYESLVTKLPLKPNAVPRMMYNRPCPDSQISSSSKKRKIENIRKLSGEGTSRMRLFGSDVPSAAEIPKITLTLLVTMALVWALILASTAVLTAGQPYYLVVAPDKLRPYSEYGVAVSLIGTGQSMNVTVDLAGSYFWRSAIVTVEPDSTEVAKFQLGDLKPGEYSLTVKSIDKFKFSSTTSLKFVDKFQSIIILTDQAIYKPEDLVRFRILFLDDHLKPSNSIHTDVILKEQVLLDRVARACLNYGLKINITKTKAMYVRKSGPLSFQLIIRGEPVQEVSSFRYLGLWVTEEWNLDKELKDGKNNRIKQWKNVKAESGIFSNELLLSNELVLGDWTIVVTSDGKEVTKSFTVAEFVHPRFEVIVDVPEHVTLRNSEVMIKINAKYLDGRPVVGNATLRVHHLSDEAQTDFPIVIEVNSTGTYRYNVVDELSLQNITRDVDVQFDVGFEEFRTGKVIYGAAMLTLHKTEAKLHIEPESDWLGPGKNYRARVKVMNWDGSPCWYPNYGLFYRFGPKSYLGDAVWWGPYSLYSGLYTIDVATNASYAAVYIEVRYNASVAFHTGYMKPEKDLKTPSLNLRLPKEKPKIGGSIDAYVDINGKAPFLSSYLIGNELIAGDFIGAPNATTKIKLPVTQAMTGGGHILVTYISHDGELIAESKPLNVESPFYNHVKISTEYKKRKPGEEMVINIDTKPNCLIGLMGIDKNLTAIKNGSDLTYEKIESDFDGYEYVWNGGLIVDGPPKRSFVVPWDPRFSTQYSYEHAGLKFLTNAIVPAEPYPEIIEDVEMGGPASNWSVMSLVFGSDKPKPIKVHKIFPETWIWDLLDSSGGKTSFKKVVPNSETTWVITAFSLCPKDGFAISPEPITVEVFRAFHLSVNLPHAMTRGEAISIPVTVFNNFDQTANTEITLKNPGWFTISNSSADKHRPKRMADDGSASVNVSVYPYVPKTVVFMVSPEEFGNLDFQVEAKSQLADHSLQQIVVVNPEGEEIIENRNFFVDLSGSRALDVAVDVDIPDNYVTDSETIDVFVVGDLLGCVVQNLDKLIRVPSGCGEQNMINFVPNIVILDYLKESGRLTPKVERKALDYINRGYQRELYYKHYDGSYSVWGKQDSQGSTWLTAFVIKAYNMGKEFIDIDVSHILDGLKFLANHQNANAGFPEVGRVSHKLLQGGGGSGLALTAYVLTAFVETAHVANHSYDGIIQRTCDYLIDQIDNDSIDLYSLALGTYALELAHHTGKDRAFRRLQERAKARKRAGAREPLPWYHKGFSKTLLDWTGFLPHESRSRPVVVDLEWWETDGHSYDVEITSYVMMAYLNRGLLAESIPILRWLVSKQNRECGYSSTQDTVTAIGAVAMLAQQLRKQREQQLNIKVNYDPNEEEVELEVNEENSLDLQRIQVAAPDPHRRRRRQLGLESSNKIKQINFGAAGDGYAIAKVSYKYFKVKNTTQNSARALGKEPDGFELDIDTSKSSKQHLVLDVCASYYGGEIGMVVMEITLPSGYTADFSELEDLREIEHIQKVETKDANSVVILYFDTVTTEKLCSTLSAYRTNQVADHAPVPIKIYDYYDPAETLTELYTSPVIEKTEL